MEIVVWRNKKEIENNRTQDRSDQNRINLKENSQKWHDDQQQITNNFIIDKIPDKQAQHRNDTDWQYTDEVLIFLFGRS